MSDVPTGRIPRRFTQPPDSFVGYADFAQVSAIEDEVVIQFYTTIPGIPAEPGKIEDAVTRLVATIIVSPSHARRLASVLTQTSEGGSQQPPETAPPEDRRP